MSVSMYVCMYVCLPACLPVCLPVSGLQTDPENRSVSAHSDSEVSRGYLVTSNTCYHGNQTR